MNLYCYCNNDPINKYDPSGHFSITSFLISVAIGALISITMEAIEDKKDGQFFNDKDFWDYFGAGVSGAIGGMDGNAVAAILLGGIASMVETAISDETTTYNMMSSFLSGAIGGLIGFGIGTLKVPESRNFEFFRKTGGENIDEILFRIIKFKKQGNKIYLYHKGGDENE